MTRKFPRSGPNPPVSARRRILRARRLPFALAVVLSGAPAVGLAQETDTATSTAAPASAVDSRRAADAAPGEALPTVAVSASTVDTSPQHLEQQVSGGALGARAQIDTPFSTTVVTSEDLADRQVYKLGDVFAGDASVADNSDANSSWATYVTVRGLPLDWQNSYKIDGKPFIGYGITLPYEQLERVELLKGLSGFMYGFGSPGGMINYVTKKPGNKTVRSVDVGFRSDGIWSEHADLGGRFGPADMFGYRFNATHEEGRTFSGGRSNRDSFSLALDARLTRDLSWDFQAIYQKRRASGQTPSIYTGTFTGSSLPRPIDSGDGNLTSNDQHLYTNLQFYSTGLSYQLSPDWTLSANYSFSKASRSRNESTLTLLDGAGDYSDSRYDGHERDQFNQWQVMLQGKARTWALAHEVVVGASWQHQMNTYSNNSVYEQLAVGNLYTPYANRYYSSTAFNLYRGNSVSQKALFASDTIALSQRWSILGGVRYTNYAQHGYAAPDYVKSGIVTPTVALMFKVTPETTAYASYVEALEQGSIVGSQYVNRDSMLNPQRSKQYEIGIKSDHERWSTTAAIFRIERSAEYANSDNYLVQDGKSIYQGIELGAATRIASQWELSGSLMWLDSWYAKGSSFDGNRVAGAPKVVAAAQIAYTVPPVPGLKLVASAKYTGTTMVRPANDLGTSSYTLVNLGARYETRVAGYPVTLRAAVDNLFNRRYWEFQYSDYIKPGDPRTISLNARLDF